MHLASPTRAPRRPSYTLLALAAVVSVSALSVAFDIPAAAARRPAIALGNATVSCSTVTGEARFSPQLRTGGTTQGIDKVHFDLALSGCSSPALPPPITISGKLTGSLVANNGTSCASNLQTSGFDAVGSLSVRWKVHGARVDTSSTFTPQRLALSKVRHKHKVATQSAKVGARGKPHPSVTGDFTGGDSGRAASVTVTWDQAAETCATGIKTLPIVGGTLRFS